MASKTLYVGDKAVFDEGMDNTPAGQTTPAAGKFTQAKTAKGADVASANALTLGTDGNYFDITGVTSITSIGTLAAGTMVCLHFDGILTLTHHATNLILPSAANITTAAGDEAIFVEYDTGLWRCISYTKADGTPLVGGGGVILSGNYVGNNTANRAIAHGLGVIPKMVKLVSPGASAEFTLLTNAEIHYNDSSSTLSHAVTAWDATNFYVGNATSYGQSANATGVSYYWVAL